MTMDLNTIITSITVALLVWGIKSMAAINTEVNGLSAWRVSHDKQDDERHQDMVKRFEKAEEKP